jgi:hypothetical protein
VQQLGQTASPHPVPAARRGERHAGGGASHTGSSSTPKLQHRIIIASSNTRANSVSQSAAPTDGHRSEPRLIKLAFVAYDYL